MCAVRITQVFKFVGYNCMKNKKIPPVFWQAAVWKPLFLFGTAKANVPKKNPPCILPGGIGGRL